MSLLTAKATKDTELGRELEKLECELAALNERRADLYRRSLEAPEDAKAGPDIVANAMLKGPLSPKNAVSYPIELQGIGWEPDNPPALELGAPVWARVQPHGDETQYLGVLVGDLASAVQAQLGAGNVLHLKHCMHVAMLFVPHLGRFVSGFSCQWSQIDTLAQLEPFAPDNPEDDPWYSAAFSLVGTFEVMCAQADAKEPDDGILH